MSTLVIAADDTVPADYRADALLASMPLSYRPPTDSAVDDPAVGEVSVVGGSGDWPSTVAAAVLDGARGVIVVDPAPTDLRALRGPASGTAAIVIDSPWASNPVVGTAGDAFRTAAVLDSRLECRVVVGPGRDLAGVLLAQLSLVRALLGPATELHILHRSAHGYSALASVDCVAVDLSAVATGATTAHAWARLLTVDGSVELHVPDGQTAQPALLSVTGPAGATLTPTRYESGHRATWRRLHDLITAGERSNDIADLEADITTASVF